MTTTLNIFISSKMVELKAERDALFELIPSLDYGDIELHAWVFEEDAPASGKSIREVYLDSLANSALYIGLFWNLYGEWTIDEFEKASEWGIERHMYVKDVEADTRDPELADFLTKHGDVPTGITAKWFKTTDELCEAVKQSIEGWIKDRLLRRASTSEAVFATTPELIPTTPKKLFGRDDLKTEVEQLLKSGEHVLLQGFPGMGKTALATTVAADWIAENGPVLWIKAGHAGSDALFESLARPFDAQQGMASAVGEEAKANLLRQILARHEIKLLVIDDAWEGAALALVLAGVPNTLPVLVTSRHRLPIGQPRDVGELAPGAALQLLGHHAGTDYDLPVTDGEEPGEAERLCRHLGFHAYALEIAGRTMNIDDLAPGELLGKIEASPHDLTMPEELALPGRHSIGELIEVSLNTLREKDKMAYNVFLAFGAFFVSSATPELLTLYMGKSPPLHSEAEMERGLGGEVETALRTLARRGLAEKVPATETPVAYYRIHDLAYSYAHVQNNDDDRKRAVVACLAYTENYNTPGPDNFAALRPEIDNFIGAVLSAFISSKYEIGRQITANLTMSEGSHVLHYLGLYSQIIDLLTLGIDAASEIGSRSDEGVYLANIGEAHSRLGQYSQAVYYLQQSLTISHETGDQHNESNRLGNLGIVYINLGLYSQAIDCFQQALTIAREIGYRRGEGANLGNLGLAYIDLGQYQKAIYCFHQALTILREIDDRRNEGIHWGNLGNVYTNLGKFQQAIEYHQKALAIAREIGDRSSEGKHLGNLGIAHRSLGQYQVAIDYLEQALVIQREIGDRHGEGNQLGNLGNVYGDLGQHLQAIDYLEQALIIARKIGDRRGEGSRLSNLGSAHFEQSKFRRAINYYQQAQDIFESIGVPLLIDQVAQNISIAQAALADEESDSPLMPDD